MTLSLLYHTQTDSYIMTIDSRMRCAPIIYNQSLSIFISNLE